MFSFLNYQNRQKFQQNFVSKQIVCILLDLGSTPWNRSKMKEKIKPILTERESGVSLVCFEIYIDHIFNVEIK